MDMFLYVAIYHAVFLLFCPLTVSLITTSYLQLPFEKQQKKLEAVFSSLVPPTSLHSPSVTAFNSRWVFKPVGIITQRDNPSIIRSKALLLPWSACHSSIARQALKGARPLGKLEACAGRCCHLFQSSRIPVLSLLQTASGNVEAKVVCFYRRRDISHSLIQLADKHASE